MILLAILLTSAVAVLSLYQTTNYCAADLCPAGKPHIGCGHNGAFSSACPTGARLVDLTPFIASILKSHNTKRNLIASGGLKGFLPSMQMATMQWDCELAKFAELNVKQCAMKHDDCRNKDPFKFVGQNLGTFGYAGAEDARDDAWLVENRIDAWWAENVDCKMEYINMYEGNYKGPKIGHFTVMAAEANTRVGCGASRFFDGKFNKFLLACNYATTNIIGRPIYKSGNTASGCTTGKNANYSSLCSTSEAYSHS